MKKNSTSFPAIAAFCFCLVGMMLVILQIATPQSALASDSSPAVRLWHIEEDRSTYGNNDGYENMQLNDSDSGLYPDDNSGSEEMIVTSVVSSQENSGRLFFSPHKVACLSRVDYQIVEKEDGNYFVVVPKDSYTEQVISTERPYLAFSKQGIRLYDDPRLGLVEIDGNNDVFALKEFEIQVDALTNTLTVEGQITDASDLNDLYLATGIIKCVVDKEDIDIAMEEFALEMQSADPESDVSVVSIPDLSDETAMVWIETINGNLDMTRRQIPGEAIGQERRALPFSKDKYRGFYPNYRPFSNPSNNNYRDFSDEVFYDSWVIDGDGFLWYIGDGGEQWYFSTTFYAIGEYVLNDNPVSKVSGQALGMVFGLMKPERAYALEDASGKTYAIRIGATDLALFVNYGLEAVSWDPVSSKCSYTAETVIRFSGEYDSARDTGFYRNHCLNPTVPLHIKAGICGFDLYFSIGLVLSGKATVSFEHHERRDYEYNTKDGVLKVLSTTGEGNTVSLAGKISGTAKVFASLVLGIGPSRVASADLCPLALSLKAATDSLGCTTFSVGWSGYAQTPSLYDTRNNNSVTMKPGEMSFSTAEGVVLGAINARFVHTFPTRNIASGHMEDGAWVKYCTAKGPVLLRGNMVTWASGYEPSFVYDGSSKRPAVVVCNGDKCLKYKEDYSIEFADNMNVGIASLIVTGKGKYSGSVRKTFLIAGAPFCTASVSGVVPKVYNGSRQQQDLVVKSGKKELLEGIDYQCSYRNNINAGTAEVIITGKGNYLSESITKSFTINRAPLSGSVVSGIADKEYSGRLIDQTPIITLGGKRLSVKTDYYITYSNNLNVTKPQQQARVVITGVGNYSGSITKSFAITPRSLETTAFTAKRIPSYLYTGSALTPSPEISMPVFGVGNTPLKKGEDYTVTYKNNTNVGKASVVIKGKGNYRGTRTLTFQICKKLSLNGNVEFGALPKESFSYVPDGKAYPYNPTLTVNGGTIALKRGIDYTVSYSNSQGNQGLGATATFTAIAGANKKYTGKANVYLKVNRASIANAHVSAIPDQLFVGSQIKPKPKIVLSGVLLKEGSEYVLKYDNNTGVGTASITITGAGKYAGVKKISFKICKTLPIASAEVGKISAPCKYTGKPVTPSPFVKVNDTLLQKGSDYTITYKNNVKKGTASLTITGKGKYTGTKTVFYTIG